MLPVDATSAGATVGQSGLAERMVDQVTYWMSQKIQGAEIKMDVSGGQTVSVSVQIKGNEAQVAFRSDQPEVRQMLTQSMPQLEKLLGSEGLLLAGATVGGNAEGSADRSASREPAPTARMGSPSIGAVASPAAPRPAPQGLHAPSGRSLDLYV
jgi:flagellar hook-length control protein FliK